MHQDLSPPVSFHGWEAGPNIEVEGHVADYKTACAVKTHVGNWKGREPIRAFRAGIRVMPERSEDSQGAKQGAERLNWRHAWKTTDTWSHLVTG